MDIQTSNILTQHKSLGYHPTWMYFSNAIYKSNTMKNLRSQLPIFIVLFVFAISCKKDNNGPGPSQSLSSTILQGNWRITYFNDSGNDETSQFSAYSFQFNGDGTVIASKNNDTKTGTWTEGSDNSQSKLILNFGNNPPFDDLNEDWHVTMQNESMIKLQHVSGGNGGTDLLYFEKL